MKTNVDFYDFIKAFNELRPNNFSREGLAVLFDYLKEMELETGREEDLDVIAICCDFTEFESLNDLENSYPDINSLDELYEYTQVMEIPGTDRFIILNY